jgi:hypothetical protein
MPFVRLIWKESRFNPSAVSPKGAQGIAQFMPATAADRGLDDPFEPKSAIVHSASLLADLRQEFGNFGLAAAAYNAGAERVRGWLAGNSGLPYETQAYVEFVTGRAAEEWKLPETELPDALKTDGEAVQDSCKAWRSGAVTSEPLTASGASAALGRACRRPSVPTRWPSSTHQRAVSSVLVDRDHSCCPEYEPRAAARCMGRSAPIAVTTPPSSAPSPQRRRACIVQKI